MMYKPATMRVCPPILAAIIAVSACFAETSMAHADAAKPTRAESRREGDPKAEAVKHFERARELYRDGNYRDAISELELANGLDPDAKDLVYNLALVSEKLGRIDDALRWMHRYAEMDLDMPERARADSTIRRLEGAKKSIEDAKPAERVEPVAVPAAPPARPMGRIDTYTIGAGAASIVGLGVGTIFGISALSSRPKPGFVTGQNGSYAELEDQAESAHTRAIVSDIGFGLFVAGGVTAACLYFMRPRVENRAAPHKDAAPNGAARTSRPKDASNPDVHGRTSSRLREGERTPPAGAGPDTDADGASPIVRFLSAVAVVPSSHGASFVFSRSIP